MQWPSRQVRDPLCQRNWEVAARSLSRSSTAGAGGSITATTFTVGPSVAVTPGGSYRVDFGGSIQLNTAALDQGNLHVHLAGAAVGIPAFFTGRNQFDGASVAASFDLAIPNGATLDLRYSTNNGTSIAFTGLWLRATALG